MKNTPISARVREETKAFYENQSLEGSGSLSMLLLEIFPTIYDRTVKKFKDLFTESELMLIIDVHNGYMLTPGMVVDAWWHIAEGIKYDALGEKWEVEKEVIVEKAQSLTMMESFILQIWANYFWYGKARSEEEKDIREYIKK